MSTEKTWVAIFLLLTTTESLASSLMAPPDLTPPGTQANAQPRNMIVMSNDHQWFYKAYTDWSDLDDDGVIDSTYKSSITYYGYFDADSCYEYGASSGDPAFIRASSTAVDKGCDGPYWSGNFLNWASMTRIDIIRKALYGGKRYRDDTVNATILERAFLPMDKHSFSKTVSDKDVISRNTPFSASAMTLCNTTYHARNATYSGQVNTPPLIRVALGNQRNHEGKERKDVTGWPKWANTETWQCPWREERSNWDDFPYRSDSFTYEYRARVEVCTSSAESYCLGYPGVHYLKPVGLLHEYSGNIDFGLLTGSYANNLRGGVLRSNIRNFRSEVSDTGVFSYRDPALSQERREVSRGIVSNLDALRIARYSYRNGFYDDGANGDQCPYGKKGPFSNGDCSNWGNPLAEILLEAVRYVSGERVATRRFSVGDGEVESRFAPGLSSPGWQSEIGEKWCAASSMTLINASDISYDGNDLDAPTSSPVSEAEIRAATNAIGRQEGISSERYFVGQTLDSLGTGEDKYCTAKNVSGLGDVKGICPTAPGSEGTYNVAGLSSIAHTAGLVRGESGEEGSPIQTYAVELGSNVPVIDVPGKNVTIIPACVNVDKNTSPPRVKGRCAIVDFVVNQADDKARGSFDVTWEDSESGGDHDLDVKVRIEYSVEDQTLDVTTTILQAAASETLGLGYVLSGTTGRYGIQDKADQIVVAQSDGFNVHQGINGYWNDYPESLCSQSSPCQTWEPSFASYRIGGGQGNSFKSPLYYAAKYGNSIGDQAYFEVDRIADFSSQLSDLLDSVIRTSRTGAASALGYGGEINNNLYQTFYHYDPSEGWSGDVHRYPVGEEGALPTSPARSAQRAMDDRREPRTIIFYGRSGVGAELTLDNLIEDGAMTPSQASQLLDFYAANKLGDFVGSTPAIAGVPNTYYVPEAEDTSYSEFRTRLIHRRPMLYVGGNDGLLHGFDAETLEERFAYVPRIVLPHLPNLLGSVTDHRYYVDGSPTVLDVRVKGGEWRSLLASGLGNGGRGIFALNVTDPQKLSANNARNIAQWEYDVSADEDAFGGASYIGYIYDKPSIVQLENGEFAVVVGNGHLSEAGKASLYILYADGAGADGWRAGEDVLRLTPASDLNVNGNGMVSVSMVDADGNGRVDTAYGADVIGNIWRFDLSAQKPWQAPEDPFFRVGNGQVISTPLEVGRHPEKGMMIFFGTGAKPYSAFDESTSTDSFYAVRDYAFSDGQNVEPLTPEDLESRQMQAGVLRGTATSGVSVRYLNDDVGRGYPKWGWRLDFGTHPSLDRNERAVNGSLLRGNRILFTTLIPGNGTCGAIESGYIYELNAWVGQAFSAPVLDINDDGMVDEQDVFRDGNSNRVAIGRKTQEAMQLPNVVVSDDGTEEFKVGVGAGGGKQVIAELPLNTIRLGRVTWRVLE